VRGTYDGAPRLARTCSRPQKTELGTFVVWLSSAGPPSLARSAPGMGHVVEPEGWICQVDADGSAVQRRLGIRFQRSRTSSLSWLGRMLTPGASVKLVIVIEHMRVAVITAPEATPSSMPGSSPSVSGTSVLMSIRGASRCTWTSSHRIAFVDNLQL